MLLEEIVGEIRSIQPSEFADFETEFGADKSLPQIGILPNHLRAIWTLLGRVEDEEDKMTSELTALAEEKARATPEQNLRYNTLMRKLEILRCLFWDGLWQEFPCLAHSVYTQFESGWIIRAYVEKPGSSLSSSSGLSLNANCKLLLRMGVFGPKK